MSEPILPFEPWEAGTNQNSIPANNNILRGEILHGLVLGIANDESSPTEGDVWQVGGSPTGAFAAFDQFDLAIYKGGGWYAFAPVEGPVFNMDGTLQTWDGAAYDEVAGGGGGAAPVVTEPTTALTADDTNAGNYTRFTNASAKTYTFDDAETYTVGDEYHGRNVGVGALTITAAGTMTINPPADGTLVIPQGGTFTVKIVSATEADLFGVTVAA